MDITDLVAARAAPSTATDASLPSRGHSCTPSLFTPSQRSRAITAAMLQRLAALAACRSGRGPAPPRVLGRHRLRRAGRRDPKARSAAGRRLLGRRQRDDWCEVGHGLPGSLRITRRRHQRGDAWDAALRGRGKLSVARAAARRRVGGLQWWKSARGVDALRRDARPRNVPARWRGISSMAWFDGARGRVIAEK